MEEEESPWKLETSQRGITINKAAEEAEDRQEAMDEASQPGVATPSGEVRANPEVKVRIIGEEARIADVEAKAIQTITGVEKDITPNQFILVHKKKWMSTMQTPTDPQGALTVAIKAIGSVTAPVHNEEMEEIVETEDNVVDYVFTTLKKQSNQKTNFLGGNGKPSKSVRALLRARGCARRFPRFQQQ